MKRIIFFALVLGANFAANAQVGIGTPTPANSAMLDVEAGNKGILIPRVQLTNETNFSPIEGEQVESLLVFNTGDALPKGFYFWNANQWNQIIDQVTLETSVTNIINGNGNGDQLNLGELKRVVDVLVPTNPNSSDKALSQAALVIDPVDGKIYSISYDETTSAYIRTPVQLEENIKEFETRTFFKKAKIEEDGQAPVFVDVNVAPDFTTTKKGEVFYQYLGEDNRVDYLNLTADVTTIIENNETIKNEITNILNQGGNVYFTVDAIDDIPANSVYYIDPETNEKVVADLSETVINSITNNTQIIKEEIGNKITTDKVIKTGNTIDGDAVFIYKTSTKITGAKAKRIEIDGKLPAEARHIDRVLNIQVFDGKKLVTTVVTDVIIHEMQTKVDFNLGNGKMYFPIAEGDYEVILEFTAK
ncbi:hypothetical protein [Myroides fluvii]|uniref:hypothetical protein n=1 Tax=Myroides fluvii TaxID=2572594 RepID=UPI00131DC3A9|nr:hypothetical protein [Myroides fluvii]